MTAEKVAHEIAALHDFFTSWFAGSCPEDHALYDRNVTDRLRPGFHNIQPSGALLDRENLLTNIRDGYGKSPEFRIKVFHVKIQQTFADGLILATYEEHQNGAQNSDSYNVRISTALLRPNGSRFDWFWVHETGLRTFERFEF